MITSEIFKGILTGLPLSGRPVLLAVSGGMDSMCMASLFSEVALPFEVAHCNFQLRGVESDADETLVREWCESKGIRFHVKSFDTMAYAAGQGISIEMAARDLRYSWFAGLCISEGLAGVAVAHNAVDNAETIMLNLLRGTGLRGLCGMRLQSVVSVSDRASEAGAYGPSVSTEAAADGVCGSAAAGKVALFRPLLGFSREEIASYVAVHGIKYHDDSTNAETQYKRNKIRHLLFPVAAEINPSFIAVMNRETGYFSQAEAVLDDWFLSLRPSLVLSGDGSPLQISLPALLSQKHWKHLLYRLLEPYKFSGSQIESLYGILETALMDRAAKAGTHPAAGAGRSRATLSGKVFAAGGYRLVTTSDRLIVEASMDSVSCGKPGTAGQAAFAGAAMSDACLVIEGVGLYEFNGLKFRVEQLPMDAGLSLKQPEGVIQWDAGAMPLPVLARRWKDGDWMRPLGMRGRRKLSDIFTDMKLSLPEKDRIVVIAAESGGCMSCVKEAATCSTAISEDNIPGGSRVAAILGKKIDDAIKLTASSKSLYRISILSV